MNGPLILVSNPQSSVLQILTILSSDYGQLLFSVPFPTCQRIPEKPSIFLLDPNWYLSQILRVYQFFSLALYWRVSPFLSLSLSFSLLPNVFPSQTIINPSTPQEAKYWLSFDQAKSCTSIQKFNFPVWPHFDWVYQIHVLLNILQVSMFHNLFRYYQTQILLLHFYIKID